MLGSQRDQFDMPNDICFLNAAAWSPLPLISIEAGRIGAARKGRPWEMSAGFQDEQVERARSAAAALIHADADDIALISSVGYGVSTAAKTLDLKQGSRIVVLDRDHTSPVLEWMSRAEASDYEIDTVRVGETGNWTEAVIETINRPGAKPAALTSISSVHWSDGGAIDLNRVSQAIRAQGGLFLIDATHAVGAQVIDVKTLDPDFLVFPTYKWTLGPYGRAYLYIAKRHQGGIPLEQTSYGRKRVQAEDDIYFTDLNYVENARRFDMGERDFFVSLGVAATSMELIARWGLAKVENRLAMLTGCLAEGLAAADVPVTYLPEACRAPNILSLGFPDGMPQNLADRLAEQNVFAAPRLGRLRLSPHVYNDEADCARFVDILSKIMR